RRWIGKRRRPHSFHLSSGLGTQPGLLPTQLVRPAFVCEQWAMASHSDPRTSSGTHRPARDLIDAVIENMRANLESLKYSTLAPSRYLVYLHPEEFARIEGIAPLLQEQTARALAEE